MNKNLADDEFFGMKGKSLMKSEKASSTTNTQPSQDEASEVIPDGNITADD